MYNEKQLELKAKIDNSCVGMYVPSYGKDMSNEFKQIVMDTALSRKLPTEDIDEEILCNFAYRDIYTRYVGFNLLTVDFIKSFKEFVGDSKCLEVMCGSGALAYFLKEAGVNIIATDNFSWKGQWVKTDTYYTDIENIDAIEAVKKYGKDMDYIIMSWAYMDDTGHKVLTTMREVNPDCKMIFIGEGQGGCTADDTFYDDIVEIEDDKFQKVYDSYSTWDGIHDRPMLIK